MFYKGKSPITRAGLGIIGAIGVVLIIVAGWSTFFASGPQDEPETASPVASGPDEETVAEAPEREEPEEETAEAETVELVEDEPARDEVAEQDLADTEQTEDVGSAEEPEDVASAEETDAEQSDAVITADTGAEQADTPADASETEDNTLVAAEGDDEGPADAGAQAPPADAAAAGGADWSDEEMTLLTADAEAGARVWNQCRACHVADEEQNRVGPHLVDVVGRDIASVEGFNYSNALQNVEAEEWTPQELDDWLTSPRDYAPGTTMSYQGLRNPEDRANLLTYLYEMQQGQ